MLRAVLLVSVFFTPCAGRASCAGTTLFFSQYQDDRAPGLNKYYQIFNPTNAAIQLSGEYSIATCANGCSSAGAFEYGYRFREGAVIAAGGTYTLCNEGLEDTTACDEVLPFPRVSYSGNDLLALIWGTDHVSATAFDVVDRIGRFTTETRVPSWTVCGETSRVVAADAFLARCRAVS